MEVSLSPLSFHPGSSLTWPALTPEMETGRIRQEIAGTVTVLGHIPPSTLSLYFRIRRPVRREPALNDHGVMSGCTVTAYENVMRRTPPFCTPRRSALQRAPLPLSHGISCRR